MAARSKSRDQRRSTRPLSKLERDRLHQALRYARSEVSTMRPLLNVAEAATLDMYRRLRHADRGAIPGVARLAEHLGWTRPATIEKLEALRNKGFIKRAADCSLYLETCEAVVFKSATALLAMALALATINPASETQWRHAAAIHHANAVDICAEIAGLVEIGKVKVEKNTAKGIYSGPQIPVIHCLPSDRGQGRAAILRTIPFKYKERALAIFAELDALQSLRQAA